MSGGWKLSMLWVLLLACVGAQAWFTCETTKARERTEKAKEILLERRLAKCGCP